MHIIRLQALTAVFPDAKYLLIQRPLIKTIPSTISLNKHLYGYFCSAKTTNPLRKETIEMLIKWVDFLHLFMEQSSWIKLNISFEQLIKNPSKTAYKIHDWLALNVPPDYQRFLNKQDEFSKQYQSPHAYQPLTKQEMSLL